MKSTRFFAFVLMAVMLSSIASALPLTIDSVELDDVELINGVNVLDLERGNEYEAEILVTPTQDLDNVEVELKISGFEYGDVNPLYFTSHLEDLDANVAYKYRIKVRLPTDVEEDSYTLRLRISDRAGISSEQLFTLKVDVPRHRLVVEDVIFHPGSNVVAGQGLLSVVRLENEGERDEDDVRVEVKIEELGLSAVDYIDQIDSGDDEEETEELFLRIPVCTETGTYPVDVIVTYDNGYERTSAKSSVTILESSRCVKEVAADVTVVEPTEPVVVDTPENKPTGVRKLLEVVLLALVALIVIVGLIIGFSKLRGDEEEF